MKPPGKEGRGTDLHRLLKTLVMRTLILLLAVAVLAALTSVIVTGSMALDQMVFFAVLGGVLTVLVKGLVEGMRDVSSTENVGE